MNERVRTSNYDLAYIDYCNGMKYKDIAEKYGVTINTVKSWKTRYKWSKDNEKSVHTKIKKVCTQKNTKEKAAAKEVEQVMKNPELSNGFFVYITREALMRQKLIKKLISAAMKQLWLPALGC